MSIFKKKPQYIIIIVAALALGIFLSIPYKLEQQESVKIYDHNGNILYDVRDEYRQTSYESIDEVPEVLVEFLLEREDSRFRFHPGFDPIAIGRAIIFKIKSGKMQGASTIDQQVIKLSDQAFSQRDIRQKLRENFLALRLNIHNNKANILLYYINNLHFPNGVRGFSTACNSYFDKSCDDLSNGHLVYLYAKSKYPHKKHIEEYSTYLANISGFTGYTTGDFILIDQSLGFSTPSTARHFVNYALENSSEVHIYTSFDTDLYQKIDGILHNFQDHLMEHEAQEACVVVLEKGEIISMNLLSKYGNQGSYINGCLIPRQVGSAIKPFVYLKAFEQLELTADSRIVDEPINFESDYGNYSPQNFDLSYHGEVSLAQALGSSLNIPAIKLANQIGLGNLYSFLADVARMTHSTTQRDDDIRDLGLPVALGIKPVTPLDFARMREIFNPSYCENDSYFCEQYGEKITEVRNILMHNENRLLSFPQYNRFDIPGVYSKSGTSRKFVDARICGGKGDKTVCIRGGNYNTQVTRTSGHDLLGPIRHEIMNSAIR